MKVDPFIEAEKPQVTASQRTCGLLEVSKSAYYQRRNGVPSARAVTDAELLEQITAIHAESKGTYGAPRIHKELLHRHVACWQAQGDQAHAPGRPRGPVQEALAHDHRRRSRRRGGPGPDPAPLRAVRGDGPALRRRHHLHLDLGGLGLPGHGHRPGQPPGRGLGPGRSHAHRAGRRRPHHGLRQPGTRARASSFIRTGAVNTRAGTSPSWPGPTASCSRSGARANAGTTPWPRSSSPPSSASSSTRVMADEGRTSTRCLRVHRGLVQHPPAALDARLPQPRSIRSCPPQRRASGGMINTSNLSVEPDQSQRPGGACWPAARRVHPGECRTAALRGRANWADPPASAWLGAPGGVPLTIDRRPGVMILLFNWPQRLLELALRTLTPAVVRFAQGPSSM